jgi:hypothetical protein
MNGRPVINLIKYLKLKLYPIISQQLYYLISSFNQVTATGLSSALKGNVSHDQVTRFLSEEDMTSKQLWLSVKPVLRQHEEDDGVIIFDDTIEEKPYTKESELVCWHHDHTKNRSVKGINLLNVNICGVSIRMPKDKV